MRNLNVPPGNHRRIENNTFSLAATLAAVALFIITSIADAARNITRALLPDPMPRLAPAGGPLTFNPMLAARPDRRGSRHAAGQFGGGGFLNRTQ